MIEIAAVGVDHYRIPLPVVLSDSTHGDIAAFELVTVRLRDAAGVEGLGYTYTVGQGGAAVAALVERDLRPVLLGAEADRIEALWQRLWWRLHYGGRGGFASLAISAVDIALWDLRARRFATPLWRLLGGHDPRVPAGVYLGPRAARTRGPAASISIFRSTGCCARPRKTARRGFAPSR